MLYPVSKLRLRHVRRRDREADRASERRPFRESPVLLAFAGTIGLVCGLWLLPSPPPAEAAFNYLGRAIGLSLIGLGTHGLLGHLLPPQRRDRTWLLLVGTVLLSLAGTRGAELLVGDFLSGRVAGNPAVYVAPYAFAPLVAALLVNGTTGLLAGLVSGLLLALAADLDLAALGLSLAATVVATFEAGRVRSRSQVLRVGLHMAAWQIPTVLVTAWLAPERPARDAVLVRMAVVSLMALGGALAAAVVLPLGERLSRFTSRITLNAFADLGHPLLQRLALEAPGTYHHSLMVANLAQSAADRIGADGLLARVGGYYHDIGKLSRPEFFIENQAATGNPHDGLPPNISRMLIMNHVKEGVCLGEIHRLPPPVLDAIREHHGTSVITWFHHKARTQAARRRAAGATTPSPPPGDTVDESHYRYAGPLPGSRESTLVALADAIEAASRSLTRVTPVHIDNLVSTIVERKLLDGQLAHSALACEELTLAKAAFVFTLNHLLHARIAYPSADPAHAREPAAALPTGPAAAS